MTGKITVWLKQNHEQKKNIKHDGILKNDEGIFNQGSLKTIKGSKNDVLKFEEEKHHYYISKEK